MYIKKITSEKTLLLESGQPLTKIAGAGSRSVPKGHATLLTGEK
jgi:hypothetical protein